MALVNVLHSTFGSTVAISYNHDDATNTLQSVTVANNDTRTVGVSIEAPLLGTWTRTFQPGTTTINIPVTISMVSLITRRGSVLVHPGVIICRGPQ